MARTNKKSKIKVLRKDNTNIALEFDDSELKKLGQKAYEHTEEDDESRSEWKQKHEDYLSLYHQLDVYDNNFGDNFTGSDGRIPLLTESCLGFQARSYKAIFPQRSFVATSSMGDVTSEETERADKVGKWMNYLLNFKMRRYKRDKKRMLLAAPLWGSDFSKTYEDPATGMPVVERVRAQDFIVNYGKGPRELSDVYRSTQRITMDINKAAKLYQSGFFSHMPEVSENLDRTASDMTATENEAEGVTPTYQDDGRSVSILEQHTYYDLDGDGIEEPIIQWIDENSKKVLRISARYDINDEDKTPIEHYTHYSFIDNTDGFYGFGYGHLIGDLNQALNQQLRNSLDAGALANSGNMGGFIAESAGIKGGEVEFPIGAFHKVPRTANDLRSSIYQMQFPGPNPAYVGLIEFMQSTIQRLANTTEAVSGDVSKVYQPMTILTMLEQSLQLPSSIMENLALSMESELDKIYRIAQKNALQVETFTYEDERISIKAEDFEKATRIYPILDPRSVTKQQKMAKAQSIYQIASSNPLMANDPNAMYTATKQVLESIEAEDIDELLPKPQQQEPERIDNQHQENVFFMLPPQDRPLFDVFPDQDHEEHLRVIDELLQGFAQQEQESGDMSITEESLQAIMLHKQKHVAYLYGQKNGVIPDGQGQLDTLDAEGGDAALVEALADELQLGGEYVDLPPGESGAVPGTGGGFEGAGELPGEGVLERVRLDAPR